MVVLYREELNRGYCTGRNCTGGIVLDNIVQGSNVQGGIVLGVMYTERNCTELEFLKSLWGLGTEEE